MRGNQPRGVLTAAYACGLALASVTFVPPPVAALAAQQPFTKSANPVSDAIRTLLAREAKNIVGSAELMPAEKYGYQPTPAQMTFAQLMAHIVQTNDFICSAIAGTDPPMTPADLKKLSETATKEALVPAVKQSFDYCTEALAKVQDASLDEEVSMLGRKTGMSRGSAMVTIATDWTDHYSTAASYLRLNGLLPPSAQPK
jgi:uncharacterized damage-inducible protein DinB